MPIIPTGDEGTRLTHFGLFAWVMVVRPHGSQPIASASRYIGNGGAVYGSVTRCPYSFRANFIYSSVSYAWKKGVIFNATVGFYPGSRATITVLEVSQDGRLGSDIGHLSLGVYSTPCLQVLRPFLIS